MFGVPRLDVRLPNKAEVLALRAPGAAADPLAIAAAFLAANRIYHDRVGSIAFVVLTDASGANRVYKSGHPRSTAGTVNRKHAMPPARCGREQWRENS